MNRRQLKKQVLYILGKTDVDTIAEELNSFPKKSLINILFSALCSTSDVVRWNAITAFGWIVPSIAAENFENARIIMRRFLWTLNDESGGIGWGAPEAMAEIMANDDQLTEEYLHMLISYMREDGPELHQDGNFLELPMLQRGLLWGIGRLCSVRKNLMIEKGVVKDLLKYLSSDDSVVRGLAVWCFTYLGDPSVKQCVLELGDDTKYIPIYQDQRLELYSVAELVQSYIHKVDSVTT